MSANFQEIPHARPPSFSARHFRHHGAPVDDAYELHPHYKLTDTAENAVCKLIRLAVNRESVYVAYLDYAVKMLGLGLPCAVAQAHQAAHCAV